ncbi:UvrD-helicase domain-containing protein [Agreia sp. VKM Ac-1783]|uniref:HelD family protein n=1 Tax=Agreia sp. VKM Ac-1783 TaxID=1938889 RepID=UPI000A2AD811|nr:UvrD-helicase domain-containing protein [Agreia sp. VKM Ac-1783]SMQ67981.1 DNA helicase IV [Agreia sp. VKM Ac-1783]
MVSTELAQERRYVEELYARLDALRVEARTALERVRRDDVGGNHQSRSERDAYARLYEDRIAQLDEVDDRLAFGRLELADVDDSDDDSPFRYIGRIGLRDEQLKPILLDWRVPQAAAFYQATAATPLGARARRHLITEGRVVTRIDDEIFDAELLVEQADSLQGEAALLAALTSQRTGRMSDIVATIQAEQDRIIRSELGGVLVVQGGPGTGKTAVALHRAAYLLYSHRERLASSGVLVVGPSRAFLQYIEAVLPSLGETGVVVSSVGGLYPGLEAVHDDAPETARVKGAAEMSGLIKRAVRSRQRVPLEAIDLDVNGERLTLEPGLIASAMNRAWETRKPHNEARVVFVKSALNQLSRLLAEQLRSHGNTVDDADQAVLREDLRTSQDVVVALNTAWLPLTPEKLLQDLYARPQWLASLTPQWSDAKRALLRRDRDAPFTISDVPLLDEAAELLGEYNAQNAALKREEKLQKKRDIENAENAIRNMQVEGLVHAEDLAAGFAERSVRGTTAEQAAADRTWTYGHIVVDEAQELSPMQWRVLARRCPLRSFTVVGDMAQASAAASARSWRDAVQPLVGSSPLGERWRLEELTVNYRTPAQIALEAEAMAEKNHLPITRATAVRESEWPVTTTVVDLRPSGRPVDPDALGDAVITVIEDDRDIDDRGTVAVIAPEATVDALYPALSESFGRDIGLGAQGLNRAIAVLTAQDAKGLEFDAVVVVDPDGILAESSRGASGLYVAMTRPTQRLHLVRPA